MQISAPPARQRVNAGEEGEDHGENSPERRAVEERLLVIKYKF